MATIKIKLPDPLELTSAETTSVLELTEPVGKHFRELEALGNVNADPPRPKSTVLDLVLICSCNPLLTPPQVDGLSLANIEAISGAVLPFFRRGKRAAGKS